MLQLVQIILSEQTFSQLNLLVTGNTYIQGTDHIFDLGLGYVVV